MIFFFSSLIIISIIDYINLTELKDKKDIMFYTLFLIITIVFSLYYFNNPLGKSIISNILNI